MKSQGALTVAALATAATALGLGGPVDARAQDRCEYRDDLAAQLDVRASDRLEIEAGSGILIVDGEDGVGEVRAMATACASARDLLEELDLRLERSGSDVRLTTDYPEWDGWGRGGDRYARLDLEITVPRGMEVSVVDGSGSMELSGLGVVTVDDGSGNIRVEDSESLWIEDGSGNVDVRDVRGDVEVHDGSGSVVVEGVGGAVDLWDGSGSIRVLDAETDVRVHDDGSGGITVDGVGGDFTVDRGRAQGIEYRNVDGRVDVPEDRRKRRRRPGG